MHLNMNAFKRGDMTMSAPVILTGVEICGVRSFRPCTEEDHTVPTHVPQSVADDVDAWVSEDFEVSSSIADSSSATLNFA